MPLIESIEVCVARVPLDVCDAVGKWAGRVNAVLFLASNSVTVPATGSEMVTLV